MSEPVAAARPRTVSQLHDLRGRAAVVTGGSRGLGLQLAHALGEAGARLLITARKADELARAEAELRAAGHDVRSFAADGSDEAQVTALVDRALRELGEVDVLVNNAGATWGAPAEAHPTAAWDKVMNLNARGLFVLTRELGRRSMLPRRRGRVVNVASVAALGGTAGSMQAIAYHASKGAVTAFTRALACEWGPHGVTVNAILPGVFPSKMAQHLTTPERAAELTRRVPLRRIGDGEDLKGAVLLFASDAGKHITGQCLAVDGGASAVISD
jgi:gluconate 5-dehydrogenase